MDAAVGVVEVAVDAVALVVSGRDGDAAHVLSRDVAVDDTLARRSYSVYSCSPSRGSRRRY